MKKALNRQTQHRTEKESSEPSKKLMYEIKGENRRLKREVARLKKELGRKEAESPIEEEEIALPIKQIQNEKCPNCDSENVSKLQLGMGNYWVCKDCKWRRKLDT
jgi:transposase-like protein